MEPTKQDAEAMLKDAEGIQLAVRARTPHEYTPFLAWGLVVAFTGPVRDLGDDSVLGSILMWVGPAVCAVLLVNYLRQSRQVRAKPSTPEWLAGALLVWVLVTAWVLPRLVDDTIGFAYTVGGLLATAPLLWWAERLRRRA